jgi:hypothetical protein
VNRGSNIGLILLLSGTTTIVIGLILAAAVGGWWTWLVVAVGVSDLFIAAAMVSAGRRRDTSENPYARED